jgi:oligoribonuclease NrnB/cAMP/cGMP phosphodiesterase (DHH superfamily)
MHRVFFHGSDFDGWASVAIYALRKINTVMYPVEYGQKIPLEVVEKNDIVAILDFCPDDFEEVQRIMEMVPVFYWIDHHKTSRKMYKEHRFEAIHTPPGQFITDSEEEPRAACELTYMYLYGCEYQDIPYYIRLLGRWDVGDYSDKQTIPFQYAMRAWLKHPMENLQQWKKLLYPSKSDHKLFQKLIEAGKYIKLYEEKKNEKEAKTLCFEMEFEGYKTLAVNRILLGSDFFQSLYNPKIHDLMLQFGYVDGQWKLSFRSETIDCAELAERFNAGGHACAAGATLSELPNEIKNKIHGR